jgi:hypothetical protein
MTATDVSPEYSQAFAHAAMDFLAELGEEDCDNTKVLDTLDLAIRAGLPAGQEPSMYRVALSLYTLTQISGWMLDTANGDTDHSLFTMEAADGRSIDELLPHESAVPRFIVAAFNGDVTAALSYFEAGADTSDRFARFLFAVVQVIRHNLRAFLNAGNPLSIPTTIERAL